VGKLPPIPLPPIKVEVRGAPRDNAKAKDSQWVRDRKGEGRVAVACVVGKSEGI